MSETATTEQAKAEPGIHLYAGDTDGANATIPLRWCICSSLFERLKDRGAKNPHLLLVVAKDDLEVSRRLLPLEQAMEYVVFTSPGEHQLFATVVWEEKGRVGHLKKALLGKDEYGRHRIHVLEFNPITRGYLLFQTFGRECCRQGPIEPLLTVNVAKEFFAKEPPGWLSKWVNWCFETKPVDQCQFRRRCIFAFTMQPPIGFVWVVLLFLTRLTSALFLFFFLGWRGISFKPIVRLRSCSTRDIWDCNKDYRRDEWGTRKDRRSFFTTDTEGRRRPAFMQFLRPFYFLGLFSLILFSKLIWPRHESILDSFILSVILWGMADVLLMVLRFFVKPRIKKLAGGLQQIAEAEEQRAFLEKQRRQEEQRRIDAAEFDRQYREMVCPGAPLRPSIEALPPRRQTFHLRFWRMKARVCKPFARG